MNRSVVSFVAPAPAIPKLITLKGLRRLREAEVVLHDRLAPPELLDEVSPGATVIDVGKAPGRACVGQGQINWLLVDWARRRERIVRVEGRRSGRLRRLGEENRGGAVGGIAFEVIPGVTARDGGGGAARHLADRARQRVDARVHDRHGPHGPSSRRARLDVLARTEGTLVFYMPVGALDSITASSRRWP